MPRTIRDILYEAQRNGPLAHGGEADIYSFPGDIKELQPYLLRHVRTFDPAWLGYTSSLTPPKQLVGGMHVGQPLLQLDGYPEFSILPRQQGVTVREWKATQSKKFEGEGITGLTNRTRTDSAFCELLFASDAANGNPFIKLFEETYRLGKLGFSADTNSGNIFVDTANGTLGLVDQLSVQRDTGTTQLAQANIQKFIKALTPEAAFTQRDAASERQVERFIRLLEEAKSCVLVSHAREDARAPAFATVDSVKAVSLDSPPRALVEQLRQLETQAEIHRH